MYPPQRVPLRLQLDGSSVISLSCQKRDHLPKCAYRTATLRRARDNGPDDFLEARRRRPSIGHDQGECLGRVQGEILTASTRGVQVQSVRPKSFLDLSTVCLGDNGDHFRPRA